MQLSRQERRTLKFEENEGKSERISKRRELTGLEIEVRTDKKVKKE